MARTYNHYQPASIPIEAYERKCANQEKGVVRPRPAIDEVRNGLIRTVVNRGHIGKPFGVYNARDPMDEQIEISIRASPLDTMFNLLGYD